jgi:DUF1680 family protein
LVSLEGDAELIDNTGWNDQLYKEISTNQPKTIKIKLIPYFAWNNRGHSEMTVWLPISK